MEISCTPSESSNENVICFTSTGGVPPQADLNTWCPARQGNYEKPSLPVWQECCVQYAGLYHAGQPHYGEAVSVCTEISTVSMFVQLLVASEFMIFPVRSLGWMWFSRASTSLYIAVILSAIVFSILAAEGVPKSLGPLGDVFPQKLGWANTGMCWGWSVGATLIIDGVKFAWVMLVDGTAEEIEIERVADAMAMEAAGEHVPGPEVDPSATNVPIAPAPEVNPVAKEPEAPWFQTPGVDEQL